jgi:transposase
MLSDLHDLIRESPSILLDELAEWLAIYHDQLISTSALSQNLIDVGYSYKLLQKATAERDNAAREAWLADVLSHFSV